MWATLLGGCAAPPAVAIRAAPSSIDDDFATQGPDAYHVPTRLLAPVIAPGWTSGAQSDALDSARYHAQIGSYAFDLEKYLNGLGLTRSAAYDSNGIAIRIRLEDLLYPEAQHDMAEQDWATFKDGHHVLISIEIDASRMNAGSSIDPDRLARDSICGPGIQMDDQGHALFRRLDYLVPTAGNGLGMYARSQLGQHHAFVMAFEGDPHRIESCTLHFADAVRPRVGRSVPDLSFRVIDGLHNTHEYIIDDAKLPPRLAGL